MQSQSSEKPKLRNGSEVHHYGQEAWLENILRSKRIASRGSNEYITEEEAVVLGNVLKSIGLLLPQPATFVPNQSARSGDFFEIRDPELTLHPLTRLLIEAALAFYELHSTNPNVRSKVQQGMEGLRCNLGEVLRQAMVDDQNLEPRY